MFKNFWDIFKNHWQAKEEQRIEEIIPQLNVNVEFTLCDHRIPVIEKKFFVAYPNIKYYVERYVKVIEELNLKNISHGNFEYNDEFPSYKEIVYATW